MKNLILAGLILACGSLPPAARAQLPHRHILGLHLAMTTDDADKRLKEIGTFERGERKQQQIWKVRDDRFSHVIIGAGKDGRLRFITAVARDDEQAKRVPYEEIGNLQQARQGGDATINNFNYEWELPPADDGQPQTLVSARGRDPKHLATLSLKRLAAAETTASQ